MTPDLVHIPYSPWSRRARWALAHLGVTHRSRPYTPTLDEPRLRWRMRRFSGRVTIPVLFVGPRIIDDGLDIVAWAHQHSDTPDFLTDACREVHAIASTALRSGRDQAGRRVLSSPAAVLGSRPPLARWLGPLGTRLTRDGWKRVLAKYKEPGVDHRERQIAALEQLEERVGDGPFVFETFSYADIAAATALAFVKPHPWLGLAPDVAAAWADPELAERFDGLIRWSASLTRPELS